MKVSDFLSAFNLMTGTPAVDYIDGELAVVCRGSLWNLKRVDGDSIFPFKTDFQFDSQLFKSIISGFDTPNMLIDNNVLKIKESRKKAEIPLSTPTVTPKLLKTISNMNYQPHPLAGMSQQTRTLAGTVLKASCRRQTTLDVQGFTDSGQDYVVFGHSGCLLYVKSGKFDSVLSMEDFVSKGQYGFNEYAVDDKNIAFSTVIGDYKFTCTHSTTKPVEVNLKAIFNPDNPISPIDFTPLAGLSAGQREDAEITFNGTEITAAILGYNYHVSDTMTVPDTGITDKVVKVEADAWNYIKKSSTVTFFDDFRVVAIDNPEYRMLLPCMAASQNITTENN